MRRVLGSFQNREEALRACEEYTKRTGFYARIVEQRGPNNPLTYVAYGYDEPCKLDSILPGMTHDALRLLAKMYLNVTKLMVSFNHMIRSYSAPAAVHTIVQDVAGDKMRVLDRATALIQGHPVYEWCQNISAGRGSLGTSTALVFLGYIDPHEATTGGKAKRYWGLTPEGKRVHGKKTSFRPELKGVAIFTAQRVIMGKDSYYYPLYQAKKQYYQSRGISYSHQKAVFWLAALLVSHAQQIIREAEGLRVPRHRMHIPPKRTHDDIPPEEVLEALRKGVVLEMSDNTQVSRASLSEQNA